ncbi:transposase [Agrobacterium vitis]|uniref:transposase n=1 Tax=Rhizobium/Agrobacterium group TaxID=227290 RepID=UPI001F2BE3C0
MKVKRKRWRELHLGLDLVSGEIICSEPTTDAVGAPTTLPDLLDQIDGTVDKFIDDGGYDGSPTRDLLATRLREVAEIIIPPPKTAVQTPNRRSIHRDVTGTSRKTRPVAGCLTEINRLQSTQPDRDPDGSMEDCNRNETESEELRQSDYRSNDRRPCSQPDYHTRPPGIQVRDLKNPKGRVISDGI